MRVMHFVTGGFSGATQVAIELCLAARDDPDLQTLLVLRRKRTTSDARVRQLREQGLDVRVVSNWLHAWTVWELRKIIRDWRPDVVFAHGFSDHIWGRRAAIAEHVPHVFHVEHNSRERYTQRRLRQALVLQRGTQASIGVSQGVREALVQRGFAVDRCIAIPNGIALERFPESLLPARWDEREPAIVMASRFARQKDHETLIRALALLGGHRMYPPLYLAGGGSQRLMHSTQALVRRLGLQRQVQFLGNVSDLPQRLAAVQIFVLSTRWEGMPLALVEAMAAGCACVVSDVLGAREVIAHEQTGLLVAAGDSAALADALMRLLQDHLLAQRLGANARKQALTEHGRDRMWQRYRALMEAAR